MIQIPARTRPVRSETLSDRRAEKLRLFDEPRAPFPGLLGPTLWARQDRMATVHAWRQTTDRERRPISLCRHLWHAAVADFASAVLYDEPEAGSLCDECVQADADLIEREVNPDHS